MVLAESVSLNYFFSFPRKSNQPFHWSLYTVSTQWKNYCKSVQKLLLNYNPKIKLLYEEIGIIGDALSSGFEKSVPMERDNSKIGIWKIKLNLKKGKIKFINRNDWLQNWGGIVFQMANQCLTD